MHKDTIIQTKTTIAIDTNIGYELSYKKELKNYHKDLFKILGSCIRDEPSRFQMNCIGYDHTEKNLLATDTTRLMMIKNFEIEDTLQDIEIPLFELTSTKDKCFLTEKCFESGKGIFPNYKKAIPEGEIIPNDQLDFKNVDRFLMSIEHYAKDNDLQAGAFKAYFETTNHIKEYFDKIMPYSKVEIIFKSMKRPLIINCYCENSYFYDSMFLVMPKILRK